MIAGRIGRRSEGRAGSSTSRRMKAKPGGSIHLATTTIQK
jgi:hypothetical protein